MHNELKGFLKGVVLAALCVYSVALAHAAITDATREDQAVGGNLLVLGNAKVNGSIEVVGVSVQTGPYTAPVQFNDSVQLGDAAEDVVSILGTATAAEVFTGTTGFSTTGYYRFGADPADAGAFRFSNADDLMWEASAAGTDVNALTVDASEVVQIGSAGASGVTITPALTVTGGLVSPKASGHHTTTGTVPVVSAGTIDTKSTDHAGIVTTVGAGSFALTFATAYTAEPACVIAAEEAVVITAKDTTSFSVSASGNIDKLNYACWELE